MKKQSRWIVFTLLISHLAAVELFSQSTTSRLQAKLPSRATQASLGKSTAQVLKFQGVVDKTQAEPSWASGGKSTPDYGTQRVAYSQMPVMKRQKSHILPKNFQQLPTIQRGIASLQTALPQTARTTTPIAIRPTEGPLTQNVISGARLTPTTHQLPAFQIPSARLPEFKPAAFPINSVVRQPARQTQQEKADTSPFGRPIRYSLAQAPESNRIPSVKKALADELDFDSIEKGLNEPALDFNSIDKGLKDSESTKPRSVIRRVSDPKKKDGDKKDYEKDDEKPLSEKQQKLAATVAAIPLPQDLGGVSNSRPMSIEEARVVALESNKEVRVLSWEPHEALEDVAIERSLFDTEFIFDANGGKLDEQTSSQIQAFDGGNIAALQTDFFTPEDDELGHMVLQKRLRSGGQLQVGWNTDYQFNNPFGSFLLVNPAWRSTVTMKIEQPLFRGRGADIALADIEVAQADQQFSTQEFYTLVHQTLRDVEVAYWDVALTSSEHRWILESAKRGFQTWKREEKLLDAGRGSRPDTLQAEEQYRRIRGDLGDARNRWGTASRELYRLMGIPVSEQQGFIEAAATPILDSRPFDPDSASFAVRSHPEYLAQYAAVEAARTVLRVETNSLQPDVAVRFAYAFSGLAENLDDAIDIMANGNFSNWTVGVVFRHPFGRRAELANVRKAHLALNREQAGLDEIHHDLIYLYQEGHATAKARMELYHEQFERRLKAEELLTARRKLYEAGRVTLDLQLRAEQAVLDARTDEAKALSDAWAAQSELRYTLGEMHHY